MASLDIDGARMAGATDATSKVVGPSNATGPAPTGRFGGGA